MPEARNNSGERSVTSTSITETSLLREYTAVAVCVHLMSTAAAKGFDDEASARRQAARSLLEELGAPPFEPPSSRTYRVRLREKREIGAALALLNGGELTASSDCVAPAAAGRASASLETPIMRVETAGMAKAAAQDSETESASDSASTSSARPHGHGHAASHAPGKRQPLSVGRQRPPPL